MPPVLDPPRTGTAAAQQGGNSLYFDMGSLLGGSLGSGLASGLTASNGALGNGWANITLSGIQAAVNQMSAITAGTPSSNSVYYAGVDAAASASWNGIQIVTVPSMPPGEIRYFYPSVSQEVFQYQTYMNGITNYITSAMGIGGLGSETTEQRIAREEREVKRRAERSAAEKRAEQLMFSILKPSQIKQYTENGWFECEVDDRVYRIHKKHSGNIELIKNGRAVERYCVHPENAYSTPEADTMIAQILALHTDEKKLLQTANKTILYRQ